MIVIVIFELDMNPGPLPVIADTDKTLYIEQRGSCHGPVDSRERYGVLLGQSEYPYLFDFSNQEALSGHSLQKAVGLFRPSAC
jgi:hypothetical protein